MDVSRGWISQQYYISVDEYISLLHYPFKIEQKYSSADILPIVLVFTSTRKMFSELCKICCTNTLLDTTVN